ncbi:conserved hypothetical protein [uncultured Desulfobacterium sp.]|uniref:DUF1902 domain-containing protein n=1 Tax=uncultured Desulfobacterium sp. TaxID=201089 RepID=A0A445MSV9_9BACT|nr:conserved hypothetical protein [uncultured Desulfobacterium sp.]
MKSSMTFNILAKKKGGEWIAHCLELDIVATAESLPKLEKDMFDLITTQVDYAFTNNNLSNLYHPAPPEVWKEFYACKNHEEKEIEIKQSVKDKTDLQTFVPPWIITKTCLAQENTSA